MLCIVFSMFVGFTTMLFAAAAVYAVGFLLVPPAETGKSAALEV